MVTADNRLLAGNTAADGTYNLRLPAGTSGDVLVEGVDDNGRKAYFADCVKA